MPPPPPPPDTYASLITHFTTLLTISLHTLLSARSLYPATTFLTARAYNIPVRQSRHPGVCAWITSAVAAVAAQLLKCAVARVVFVIFEADGKGRVLERWVWDLSSWPVVPGQEMGTRIVRADGEAEQENRGNAVKYDVAEKYMVDMEEQFRALLSRLSNLPSRLRPLPANCTFTLCIELRDAASLSTSADPAASDDAAPPIGHPQPWIPAQPSSQKTITEHGNERYGGDIKRQVRTGEDIGGKRTIPVRAVEAGEMRFEMWVEEGAAKFETEQESVKSGGGMSGSNGVSIEGQEKAAALVGMQDGLSDGVHQPTSSADSTSILNATSSPFRQSPLG